MRRRSLSAAILGLAAVTACVGDGATQPPPDASGDATPIPDAGNDVAPINDATTGDAGVVLPTIADLKLWFRADVAPTTTGVGLTWADQGPFKLDALAAADAGTNGYPVVKTNFFPNGMPGVTFDTDPQLLRMPDSPQFTDLSGGVSIFVAAIPSAAKAGQWISFGASTSNARLTMGQTGTVFEVALGATVYPADAPAGATTPNQQHVFVATIKGTGGPGSIAFYRDGVTAGIATGTTLQNTSRALDTIGGSQTGSTITTSPVGFGEILVYSRVVTPGERTSIETYLKARWATP